MASRPRTILVLMALLCSIVIALPSSAAAATGDLVGTVNFSEQCGGFQGIGVGITFDGTNLWYSCAESTPDLFRADPQTGNVTASYTIGGGIGSLAYDAADNVIYAGWGNGSNSGNVYAIQLDANHNVVGSSVKFTAPDAVVCGLDDGLAFDGSNKTLYISDDCSTTIYHYDAAGNLLDSFPWAGSSCYNSGLALGNQLIFEGGDGCNTVTVVDKSDPATVLYQFSTAVAGDPNFRDEGLSCDTSTFPGKDVMWSKEAYAPERAHAFEIPAGSCGEGGNPVSTDRYVALGDSVPYGHGLSNPYPTAMPGISSTGDGPSPFAYPGLVQQFYGLNMSIRGSNCLVNGADQLLGDDLAFSGAAVANADAGTAANDQCPQQFGGTVTLQSNEVPAASLASNPAKLVTIQAGADDIHFSDCLAYDLARFGPVHLGKQCVSNGHVTSAVSGELANVRSELATLIEQIHPYTQTIAVLNYYQPIPRPQNFVQSSVYPNGPSGPNAQVDEICWALARNLQGTYNDAVVIQSALNNAIDGAVSDAESAGVSNVKLVDLSQLELTHEMCTGKPAVFSGVPMPRSEFNHDLATLISGGSRNDLKAHKWRTAHPNQFGQQDIAHAIEATLGP